MRAALLVPEPATGYPWQSAFDGEANALARVGIKAVPLVWSKFTDFGDFDLVLPLLAWGYHHQPSAWLAMLDHLEQAAVPVINPVPVLRWNSDKAYLAEFARRGVATVPTRIADHLDEAALDAARAAFRSASVVIKPLVSGAADGTVKLSPSDAIPVDALGKRMIVQPMINTIHSIGEYSLFLFGGALSHCIIKRPRTGDFRVQTQFGGTEHACDPPAGGEALAHAALAMAPAAPAYARVDMVIGTDGEPCIMELELIEPALFLEHSPDRGAAFAQAIASAANSAVEQKLADR